MKKTEMKKTTIATICVAIISILYIVSSRVLAYTELSYRMWVQVCGSVAVLFILPLFLMISMGKYLCGKMSGKKPVKLVLSFVMGAGYLLWAYWAILLMAFSINTERRLTDNLLLVNKGFLEPYNVYYRPVAFFFRVPGELTDDVKVEYLEEKYHEKFYLSEQENTEGKIYAEKYPEMSVSVSLEGMELTDNYIECVTVNSLVEGCRELGITREYYVSENYAGHSSWMYMELKDEADISAFAKDASKLIQYVTEKSDLWEDYRGVLLFYSGEEQEMKGQLPFGKLSQWDKVSADYYLYPEQIEVVLAAQYENDKDRLDRRKQLSYEVDRNVTSEQDNTEASQMTDNVAVSTIEQAADIIYNNVLKADGYPCEVKYNASGNLYLDLGSKHDGQSEDKSSTGTHYFSLVYDRTSKNGACELFVLYKAHYTEDGINDSTVIMDMYAVEIATGNVIAADKHSWEEVGSQAYRDATGE